MTTSMRRALLKRGTQVDFYDTYGPNAKFRPRKKGTPSRIDHARRLRSMRKRHGRKETRQWLKGLGKQNLQMVKSMGSQKTVRAWRRA